MSAVRRRQLTADEFAALPDAGLPPVLVRGEIIARPPAFDDRGDVAGGLTIRLGHHVLTHEFGKIYAAETGFLVAERPDTVRAGSGVHSLGARAAAWRAGVGARDA